MANMETMRLRIEGNKIYYGGYGRGRGQGRSRGCGRGRGQLGRGCGGHTGIQRHMAGTYFQTHDNCAHSSSECETPVEWT